MHHRCGTCNAAQADDNARIAGTSAKRGRYLADRRQEDAGNDNWRTADRRQLASTGILRSARPRRRSSGSDGQDHANGGTACSGAARPAYWGSNVSGEGR